MYKRQQLLVDYVTGALLGATDGEAALASKIARVVVAGDLVAPSTLSAAALSERHLDQATQERLVLPVREADVVLAQLCAALPVDVLPGASDPVNHALPQQPLHACLTPCAARYSTLHAHTNPFAAAVGGKRFFGTAGQPVADLLKFLSLIHI